MDNLTLGKRIKEARLAKKMTQTEVVGTFITRNMLSQIESGNATPSIKTLSYLSSVLEIPMEQLVSKDDISSSENTTPGNTQENTYFQIKQLFLAQEDSKVLELATEYLQENYPYYDELCAIYSRCCLRLATKHFETSQHAKALTFAQKAEQYAQLGCYSCRDVRTQAIILMNNISDSLLK